MTTATAIEVTRTYLEMRDPSELNGAQLDDPRIRIEEQPDCSVELFRFLYAEGKRKDDPAAVIKGPKRGRALPKVLSIAEVDRLLAQARSDAEDTKLTDAARLRAARLLCLLETIYATGLRVSELVALPASAA